MLPLLSLSTEIFFWFLTLALLVLTVIFWHKFAIHNWKTITARFSTIILIQVLALASMGITINRSGEFYSSWSDLFGAQGQYQKIACLIDATWFNARCTQYQMAPLGEFKSRSIGRRGND